MYLFEVFNKRRTTVEINPFFNPMAHFKSINAFTYFSDEPNAMKQSLTLAA